MSYRYDQATQAGRFATMLDVADPRCLAPGLFFGMPFDEARQIVGVGATPAGTRRTDREWLAKKIVDSRVHPDTGDIIPAPLRMCGYAVFGSPIVIGMLLPNPAGQMLQTVGWQTANQTHNAAVNYANRNATNPTSVGSLALGFASAVGISAGIGLGLAQAIKRSALSLAAKTTASRYVAYPAVAVANVANLVLMRRTELDTGVQVKDALGNARGSSQLAANRAIKDTALTRMVLPMPILLIPPTIIGVVERHTSLFNRFPRSRLPFEAAVCVCAFMVGLPAAVSLFPQEGEMDVSSLEPRFSGLVGADGEPITSLRYNKGL